MFKGPVDSKNEAAMSELVPEPRQKPVVPMKPMGINTSLLGYIGIDTIIEQMRKKTMKTGFDFNIMVVGRQRPAEELGTMARDCPGTEARWEKQPCGEGMREQAEVALRENRACTRQGDTSSPFPCQPGSVPWACCHHWGVANAISAISSSLQSSGQSGLGKSTLVNTLFKSQVSRKSSGWNREEKIPKTVEIKAIGHVIEEGGVKMKLTVIDTPGFGDQINNENCWEPIEKYINEQYEKFLKEEVNIARKKRIPDTCVHCCLYFISPTGHSLRPLDLEFMKHLSKVVNIIPVIAKADTMTLEEKTEFKQRVRKELEVNGIEFYPQKEFDEDLEDKTENDKIRQESMPFAVVGSDKEYQVNGKRVLGRKTPWGIIEGKKPLAYGS
uniref:Septin n=1 Tax=Geospiza parvula TaxID=87175 RepID=A0A8C3N2K3_GEOPR